MTPPGPRPLGTARATLVDNIGLLRGAPDVPPVISLLQDALDPRFERARILYIRLAPAKADLLHLVPLTSN